MSLIARSSIYRSAIKRGLIWSHTGVTESHNNIFNYVHLFTTDNNSWQQKTITIYTILYMYLHMHKLIIQFIVPV